MKEYQILEGNKLIAEFMGYEGQHEEWCGNNIMCNDELLGTEQLTPYYPNKSWDWLMLAVDKISTLKFKYGRFSTKIVTLSRNPYCRMDATFKAFRNSTYKEEPLIICVYKTVLDFLEWYNLEADNNK